MGRALPRYDPDKDGPYETSRRRREIFKRTYQKMGHWRSLQYQGVMTQFLTSPDGEEIFYGDLMVGHDSLPPQQRKAFDLICLQEYTESAATEVILPESKWSTPVQQYSDDGLKKMIKAYDSKQQGTWDPEKALSRKRIKQKEVQPVTTPIAPEVPEEIKQDDAQRKFSRVDHLNWNVCSRDNQSLADFINAKTGLNITGQQVKAVKFLHNPWYHSPEQQEYRRQEAERKEAEKAKFANETPDQREARFAAERRARAAAAALEKARRLEGEVRYLRQLAGLDPDTGEPIPHE